MYCECCSFGLKFRADVNRKYGVVKLEMTNDIPNCTAVGGNNRINIQTNVALSLSPNAQCLTLPWCSVRVFVYKMQMCMCCCYTRMDGTASNAHTLSPALRFMLKHFELVDFTCAVQHSNHVRIMNMLFAFSPCYVYECIIISVW